MNGTVSREGTVRPGYGAPPRTEDEKRLKRARLWRRVKQYRVFYLLLIPVVAFYAVFSYVPMYGITLAFKKYMFNKGVLHSPWVGLDNFRYIFRYSDFWTAFRNTILISCGRLLVEFPMAIIMALLLNEIARSKMKRLYQTVFTFPHFLSWVVLGGILVNILGNTGAIATLFAKLDLPYVSFLGDPATFRPLLYITNIWKEAGWGAIIYFAAIAGISPELYEAAYVDGANRWKQMLHITWPSIRGVVAMMLILAVGGIMDGGFDQIFNLYSAPVYQVADTLDTFMYRLSFAGRVNLGFGIVTAVGLFKSIISLCLLVIANQLVKRLGQEGLV
ncbi:sugar ABC transporter permease [Paenibacillus sp. MWE-103]|uniref:Sugar ABC transporter permease n=1 Tax=Paenibacillus artemisiicola TaxID=1172618 RepID=A0ABS3WEH7_9BACL|nr:ABC transporter permease subunit [Paenibacillus artemisiicola]MBO7746667.1 sugar ABC transporter permease [Paenibacillus artemisiicola]